ncbi:ParA family protein [Methylocapsa polymorpha]|uniref:ParA family protein n=1 Tax=Methylocapsa polymorpha TaxID=3080828 RepID=A0ABZ0HRC7_9HYPH|nr:ParA family protein [Methylocapsa sp. RX1]
MAGKLISVANMKGGVGKTTTVVSLAEALAADNPAASILVVDLDPQASASVCLAGDDILAKMIRDGNTIDGFLEDRLVTQDKSKSLKIRGSVSSTCHAGNPLKISLVPCGPQLRIVERNIVYLLTARNLAMAAIEQKIWKLFETEILPLSNLYDYIIFDCPPGISTISEVAIRASDLVLVPTIPDFISVYGLRAFYQILWQTRTAGLPLPKLLPQVLITRFQRNLKQHKEYVERLEASAKLKDPMICVLETKVQQAAALAEALSKGDEIPTFNRKYKGVTSMLDQLVQELKGVLHGN